MGVTIFFLGIFGCLGMTWLFPIISRLFWQLEELEEEPYSISLKKEISILIPARNEQETLPGTLWSIINAIEHVKLRNPDLKISIVVGADSCTDQTTQVADDFGAEIVELKQSSGKWETLLNLIDYTKKSEWVVLVDSGTIWPEDFLTNIQSYFHEEEALAIAPTYKNNKGGIVEGFLWGLERHLKSLEDKVGGPVSVHGATVAYRRKELGIALTRLCQKDWLNDDIVLPLTLRSIYPEKRIRYLPKLAVTDFGATSRNEFQRRKRMAIGNLEWISELFPEVWRLNKVAGLIALRRVFRVTWAYWLSLVALAFVFWGISAISQTFIAPLLGTALLAAALLYYFDLPLRSLWDAARASFAFPYYVWAQKTRRRVVWQ